jgi:AcrR family transcriptional regulator
VRTRKRVRTERDLADAAYSVVRDVGFDAVTADAVADRAGVSRRTFFNYYPSVESVFTASVAGFFVSVGERLEARPLTEDLLDSALAVVTDPGDSELVERIAVLAAAGESSTHARGLILVELHAWLDWLEGWLRGRLAPDTDDLLVATYASALVGTAEAAFRVWARDPLHLSLRATLADALGHLRTGLDPARPTPATA